MTATEVINRMKSDKCLTPSRSRSKMKNHNYSNKYTRRLGQLGYKGINPDGYFTKIYSYGVAGHCCAFVQYWFLMSNLSAFVPKNIDYIWNTNVYANWLKKEPYIKGYGKVEWTSNAKKAKPGSVCFKGKKGSKKFSHTCTFLKYEKGYVYTVDGNVSVKYKGKRINNGAIKKRKVKDFRWGFAAMPYPSALGYKVGKQYTCQQKMNIRQNHSTKSKIMGHAGKGSVVKPVEVYKTQNGVTWIRFAKDGWICARTPKNIYLK